MGSSSGYFSRGNPLIGVYQSVRAFPPLKLNLWPSFVFRMEGSRNNWDTMSLNEILKKVDLINFEIAKNEIKNSPPNKEGKEITNDTLRINPNSAYLGPNLWNNTNIFPLITQEELVEVEVPVVQSTVDFHQFIGENANTLNQGINELEDYTSPPNHRTSSVIVARPSLIVKRPREEDFICEEKDQEEENDFLHVDVKKGRFEEERTQNRRHFEMGLEFDSADLALATRPGQNFDPKKPSFDISELKPQPIIRKRKKTLVPEHEKDEKYWERRQKNTEATKKAREAKRLKENQIGLRAAFLEAENKKLKEEMENMIFENKKVAMERDIIKKKLAVYEQNNHQDF